MGWMGYPNRIITFAKALALYSRAYQQRRTVPDLIINDRNSNLKNAEMTKSLADQTLKNDIYKAYYNATAALEKFNAAKVTLWYKQKSYDFAKKRYELGLLNTFDLITVRTI